MSSILPELLHYLQMSDADVARLAVLHPLLEPHFASITVQFYEAVWSDPKTAAVLSGPAQLERLRASLVDWMSTGLRGPFDERFYEKRSRIGRRHVEIGLAQQYMFVAMNVVRLGYQQRIVALCAPHEVEPSLRAVNKLLDLELAIMVHHYHLDSEERLLQRERRLQADRITSMRTMTAGLAHEIRNPLNAATLQLQLLDRRLRRAGDDPKLTEPIALAQHEINRLTELTNDFLAFARPPELQAAERDVAEIVRKVCELESPTAELRTVTLTTIGATAPVVAYLDGGKLHQIVDNLVRNAVAAAPDHGHVSVELARTETGLSIIVTDDGPGVPTDALTRIYEPFYTTKSNGTGLGMSIVHSLVALHGGTISLTNGAPGARFAVTLPITPFTRKS